MKYDLKGFEVFFSGAIIYSIISILIWFFIYIFSFDLHLTKISIFQWHAHEMVYGYTTAVIAGYMLRDIRKNILVNKNYSSYYIGLPILWAIPRFLFCFGDKYILYAMIFDISFIILLNIFIFFFCIKTKQYKQTSVLSKLIFILTGNSLFYLGVFNHLNNGISLGLYFGVYIIISLILTVGKKLIPVYINNKLEGNKKISSPRYLDILNLFLFLALFIYDLFISNNNIVFYLSIILFLINIYRLRNWYNKIIWKDPLIWAPYISFVSISIGFILIAYSIVSNFPKSIAIHSFTFGGIGLITMSMMLRVIIEELSIDYSNIIKHLNFSFSILLIGDFFRVILPIFDFKYYLFYIAISQILWVISFIIYIFAIYKKIYLYRL